MSEIKNMGDLLAAHSGEQTNAAAGAIAESIAQYYHDLIENDVPDLLAQKLTLQFQDRMMDMAMASNAMDVLKGLKGDLP